MKMFLHLGLLATVLSVPLQLSPKHDSQGSFVETMSSSRLGKDVCNQYEFTKGESANEEGDKVNVASTNDESDKEKDESTKVDEEAKKKLCAAPIYAGIASKPSAKANPDPRKETEEGQSGDKFGLAGVVHNDILECSYLKNLLDKLNVKLSVCGGTPLDDDADTRAGLIRVSFKVGEADKMKPVVLQDLTVQLKQLEENFSKSEEDGVFPTMSWLEKEELKVKADDNAAMLAITVMFYNALGVKPANPIHVKCGSETCMDSDGINLEFSGVSFSD